MQAGQFCENEISESHVVKFGLPGGFAITAFLLFVFAVSISLLFLLTGPNGQR